MNENMKCPINNLFAITYFKGFQKQNVRVQTQTYGMRHYNVQMVELMSQPAWCTISGQMGRRFMMGM